VTRISQIFTDSKLAIFSLCLVFIFGCEALNTKSVGTWRASVDNGDKPGIGIELNRTTNGIAGFIYLLDPNKPRDFAAGMRLPMQIHQITEQEIHFDVDWSPNVHDKMVLRLAKPLGGNSVNAVLQSTDGQDEPRDYEFIRIK
jgi:hypothetical protein